MENLYDVISMTICDIMINILEVLLLHNCLGRRHKLAKFRNFGSPRRKNQNYPLFLQNYFFHELECDKLDNWKSMIGLKKYLDEVVLVVQFFRPVFKPFVLRSWSWP